MVRRHDLKGGLARQRGIGGSRDQPPAVGKRLVQPASDGPDRLWVEVDQNVATKDQIHPPDTCRARGVEVQRQVEVVESDEPAHDLIDDVVVAMAVQVGAGRKGALAAERPGAIGAPPCFDQARSRQISRQQTALSRQPLLEQQNRQRVGLFPGVPELATALEMLAAEKFVKMIAFPKSHVCQRVRTNNHVERVNRKLRYEEKPRYKWRTRHTTVRFLVLLMDRYWRRERAIWNRWPDEPAL